MGKKGGILPGKGLTPGETATVGAFCENGFNQTEAVVQGYGWERSVANRNAPAIFKRDRVQKAIAQALGDAGITTELVTQKLRELIEEGSSDNVRLGAIKVALERLAEVPRPCPNCAWDPLSGEQPTPTQQIPAEQICKFFLKAAVTELKERPPDQDEWHLMRQIAALIPVDVEASS